MKDLRALLQFGLIVSCHRDANEPFESIPFMAAMAKSAELGGAAGLRVEGTEGLSEPYRFGVELVPASGEALTA